VADEDDDDDDDDNDDEEEDTGPPCPSPRSQPSPYLRPQKRVEETGKHTHALRSFVVSQSGLARPVVGLVRAQIAS
jgi:hypothetical protein